MHVAHPQPPSSGSCRLESADISNAMQCLMISGQLRPESDVEVTARVPLGLAGPGACPPSHSAGRCSDHTTAGAFT